MLKRKFQYFGHLIQRPNSLEKSWCWERLKAGGEGDDRGWDGWMASLTQWTWVWTSSGRWWRTGKAGVLQSMGSQRVRHNLTTEQQQNHGSVFLVSSTHPGSIHAPTKTHFIRTKAAVEISRDLGCLCKLLRSLPFLSNDKEFRSSVSKKKKRWWDQAHISQYVTVHALVSDPGQLRQNNMQFKSHWHITRILPSLYCLVHCHKKTTSRMMSLRVVTLHFILSASKC